MMGLYVTAVLTSVLCCSGFSSSQYCTLQMNKLGGLTIYNLCYDVNTTYTDSSCEAQWTTDQVIALKSENQFSFIQPVLNVTDTSLTTSKYFRQLTFQLDCPDTGVFRKCNITGVNNTKADEKEETYGSVIIIIIIIIITIITTITTSTILIICFVNKLRKKKKVYKGFSRGSIIGTVMEKPEELL